jgi:hypothetical protein
MEDVTSAHAGDAVSCCVCDKAMSSTASHRCVSCQNIVHVFCGRPVGEEGYGASVCCKACDSRGTYISSAYASRHLTCEPLDEIPGTDKSPRQTSLSAKGVNSESSNNSGDAKKENEQHRLSGCMNGTAPTQILSNSSARHGGKRRESVEVRRLVTMRPRGRCNLPCCNKDIHFNVTRAKMHFLSCSKFHQRFPESLIALSSASSAQDSAAASASAPSILSKKRRLSTIPSQEQTVMEGFLQTISAEKRNQLDKKFATAVIKAGSAFSTANNTAEWREFRRLAFGGAWTPPSANLISTRFLTQAGEAVDVRVRSTLVSCKNLCTSVDGFTDVNGASVLKIMLGSAVPFFVGSLRRGATRETSEKLSVAISSHLTHYLGFNPVDELKTKEIFAFVSDSPNVMLKTRRILEGTNAADPTTRLTTHSGASCPNRVPLVAFSYGCACHTLSNCVKDLFSNRTNREVLKSVSIVASFFTNTHLTRRLLREKSRVTPGRVQTVKSFSLTRWNGSFSMFLSIKENESHMLSVLTEQRLQSPSEALLDVHKRKSKASHAYDLVTNGSFWDGVEEILPVLKVFSDAVTFLEGDTTPVSMVPIAVAAVVKEVRMTAEMTFQLSSISW